MAIGRIGRPHGVRGELRLDPMGGLPAGLGGYKSLYIADSGDPEPLELEAWRPNGDLLLITVKGYKGRDEAAALTGKTIYAPRADLPPLEADEYYHCDVIGSVVVDSEGKELGKVVDIKNWGDYDMLVIASGRKSWMLPVLDPFVGTMDIEGARITVNVPEGLGP